MTDTPVIIAVAITGSVPRKADTPAVPVTPAEQVESTHEAFEAGASLVHVHVRDDDEAPSSDVDRFVRVLEGVRRHCPGMIVQFSTGGRGRDYEDRIAPLRLKPDMGSLATGSVNFPTSIYPNPPDFVERLAAVFAETTVKPEIEVFDLSMLYTAVRMAEDGLLARPLHVQFVMGIRNALPARREALEFMVAELRRLAPDATWTAAGIGRAQRPLHDWALDLGGHLRTGLEDNIRLGRDSLADSNAALVRVAVEACTARGRRPATAAEARRLLTLPPT
ncbi:3-keto-5-aminohexanoate cleavage protein [Caenispirillum bisanense]|uniref:Uncharacterized conserved protein, DUF849 family n=1 Tax=Caenispirillum bisanense TaxID=414052 RepID=A0A286GXV6_9PROT|nr:3-keto-5-aminohexanoate cleavage protein [Caenispirillum bisanense]SOD99904.1 Uncharacterized conserved protein, DUF849 family [Caenispirillum bisanense]